MLAAAVCGSGCAFAVTSAPYGVDLNGRVLTSLVQPGDRAVVLVFFASDCPISNRYMPEVERLAKEFASRGVRFWIVYPNPGETLAALRQHHAEFGGMVAALRDPDQSLVHMANVRITPEAAVFVQQGSSLHEAYHGRIDDRYLNFGEQRPQASRHDVEEAIAAVLAGHAVTERKARPVGCAIVPRQ